MKHAIALETDLRTGRTRAVCICGHYRSPPRSRSSAETAGKHHVEDMGDRVKCWHVKFASKEEADQAVISAKLSRLRGNLRRREQRSYFCDTCQAWHLTESEPWEGTAS